ncbi:MAG: hypothetical protein RBR74_11540, partial [Ignavibacteriaceae bacterium]|nr:hypothetical protein [Ignavibacteriaceae bacterium]
NDADCDPDMLGTLQWAINKSNDDNAESVIEFNIPGNGPHEIVLNNYLPQIIGTTVIDGRSQSGYTFGNPQIIVNAQNKQNSAFNAYKTNVTIKGLKITSFAQNGILLQDCSNSVVAENIISNYSISTTKTPYIGLFINGCQNVEVYGNEIEVVLDESVQQVTKSYGVYLSKSYNCTIGGTGTNMANTIKNCRTYGVFLNSTQQTKISGNVIFGCERAIYLNYSNDNIQPPVISSYTSGILSGTALPNSTVEVFGSTGAENANEYLVSVVADEHGEWNISINISFDSIVATQYNLLASSSAFSNIFSIKVDNLPYNWNAFKSNIGFLENKGQFYDQNNASNLDAKFMYQLHGINNNGINIVLKTAGFSYDTYSYNVDSLTNSVNFSVPDIQNIGENSQRVFYDYHRVDVEFLNSNETVNVITEGKSPEYYNYYNHVTPENGSIDVYHYKKVFYKDLYSNIDIEYIACQDSSKPFKYNLIVKPGGFGDVIKLKYNGAYSTQLVDGCIHIEVSDGVFIESIPTSYILEDSSVINVSYYQIDNNTYGFIIPPYDNTKTLIIDPIIRDWGLYYGGLNSEIAYDSRIDNLGNLNVCGYSSSNSMIATAGTYQTSIIGNFSAFLSRIDINGNLIWSSYYGYNSEAYSCAVNQNDDVYIVGWTNNFGTINLPNTNQSAFGGGMTDGFIAKFDLNGHILWHTYYGGSEWDILYDCSVINNTVLYVCGYGQSSNNISTSGTYQTLPNGAINGYLAQFAETGVRNWSTYFGGENTTFVCGCTTDSNNDLIICGRTNSATNIATPGSLFDQISGDDDGFLAKFDNTGTIIWGTYFGGSNFDLIRSVCTHQNEIYFTGLTNSTDLPVTFGAVQPINFGQFDSFISRFDTNGLMVWNTYYGGSNDEDARQIIYNHNSNTVYVSGYTNSSNFYIFDAYQPFYGGNTDAFLVSLNNLGGLDQSTYYGSIGNDRAFTVCDAPNGDIYVGGETESSFSISTLNSFHGGQSDAFIVKFNANNCLLISPPVPVITTCSGGHVELSVTASNAIDPINYYWDNNTSLSCYTCQNPIATPIANTGYSVTIIDANGCSVTNTVWVNIYPTEYPIPTNTGPYCIGEDIELSVSNPDPNYQYSWSADAWNFNSSYFDLEFYEAIRPNAQNNICCNINPYTMTNFSGDYTVTATDQHGCTASATTHVEVVPDQSCLYAESNSPICAGEELRIELSSLSNPFYSFCGIEDSEIIIEGPSGIYDFDLIGQAIYIYDLDVDDTGTFTITINSPNNCSSIVRYVDVSLFPQAWVSL